MVDRKEERRVACCIMLVDLRGRILVVDSDDGRRDGGVRRRRFRRVIDNIVMLTCRL